ncbi:MAG: sugar phosphate isomerase/epimerase [Myxococcales bacterium]|nr:sugar phosphate isomerase/epimerase [Myxococcales bacterium]
MRLAAGGRLLHLGICTNVLPGETVEALHEQLTRYFAPLRAALGEERLGIGLWIAAAPAARLAADAGLIRALRAALDDAGLYAFTLNAFPYGGFHAPRVKERVFQPGWDHPARVRYTLDCATVLAGLLPDDVTEGTISTVPLGAVGIDLGAAAAGLSLAAAGLARIERAIRLCLEPEPGAALETVAQAARFLAGLGDARARLGVCFDTCHAAVVGEEPDVAFAALHAYGVRCGKVQISSALVLEHPERDDDRAHLASFDEPRFFHQVRGPGGGAMDLPEALAGLDRAGPWRVHFHVPIHRGRFGVLGTTAAGLPAALAAALAAAGTAPHLEVETYTWSVLPEGERPETDAALVAGLAQELAWARARVLEAVA